MGRTKKEALVRSKCRPEHFQDELNKYVTSAEHILLKSDFNYSFNTKIQDVICTCYNKATIKTILPITENMQPVICYPQCVRSLFTSMMRQCVSHTKDSKLQLDNQTIDRYHNYCDKLFEDEIRGLLDEHFSYEIEDWLNHLKDYNKQLEVMPHYKIYLQGVKEKDEWYNESINYTLFSKKEKQIVDIVDGVKKYPKCRSISACSPTNKWIMGPVILELERIFGKYFKGYKIKLNGQQCKTWEQIEDYLEYVYSNGNTKSIDIDGSRWDTTIRKHMRYLPFKIYNYLCDTNKIHHVTPELFRYASTATKRKLTAKAYINHRSYTIMSVMISNTTFSGSPDTTFSNTVINASVGRYIAESEMQLDPTQYEIMTAGDDFSAMFEPNAADIYASLVPRIWNGLGLVPKYCLTGDFSEITFCSTNVIPYRCNNTGRQKFKLVRLLNRMNPLSHYSIEAMSYSKGQLKYYYQQLALGVTHWAHDMPYYSDYAHAFEYQANLIKEPPQTTESGKPKLHFQGTDKDYSAQESNFEQDKKNIRISSRNPPKEDVYSFLMSKYHIGKSQISANQKQLMYCTNYIDTSPVT